MILLKRIVKIFIKFINLKKRYYNIYKLKEKWKEVNNALKVV